MPTHKQRCRLGHDPKCCQRNHLILHGPFGYIHPILAIYNIVPVAIPIPVKPHIHIHCIGEQLNDSDVIVKGRGLAIGQHQRQDQAVVCSVAIRRVIARENIVARVFIRAKISLNLQRHVWAKVSQCIRRKVQWAKGRRPCHMHGRIVCLNKRQGISRHGDARRTVGTVRGITKVVPGPLRGIAGDHKSQIHLFPGKLMVRRIRQRLPCIGSIQIHARVIPMPFRRRVSPAKPEHISRGIHDACTQPVHSPRFLDKRILVYAEIVLIRLPVIAGIIISAVWIEPSDITICHITHIVLPGIELTHPKQLPRATPRIGRCRNI